MTTLAIWYPGIHSKVIAYNRHSLQLLSSKGPCWMLGMALRAAFAAIATIFSTVMIASGQNSSPPPSTDAVVAKMIRFDAQRQAELAGYTAIRHYVAVNKSRRAEMLVRMECSADGTKGFTILSESGSGAIRRLVFQRLISEETEASRRGSRNSNRLIPENYEFRLVAQDILDTGPAYVLTVSPKTPNKYLIDGRIWVDANDYSIVRIEGKPARNPSFWVRSVHFVHTYQKIGPFWFALATRTTSEIRIFGESQLMIESSDYKLNPQENRTALRDQEAAMK